MKGYFIFPPDWSYSHPYLSIPCIMPYLKKEFDIIPLDLNIEFRKFTRSEKYLKLCYEKIEKITSGSILEKYRMVYEFLILNEKRTYDTIHNFDKFLNIEEYILASLYELELRYFRETANGGKAKLFLCETIEDTMDIIENEEINYYLDFYKTYFQNIDLKSSEIIMVSLAGTYQMIPALTLCRFVKKMYPNIKIIVGGNPFTKIINRINDKWKVLFQKVFDYISVFEGEYLLPKLLRCLRDNGNLSDVQNCIYMKKGEIIKNVSNSKIVDFEHGLLPDFDNFPLSEYSFPERILPYNVTRGCYWKRCTFCDHDFGYADCFRMKSISKIINDLLSYKDKYNVKYVHFVDEAIPPKVLEKLCNAMIEKKLEIKWFTCIKASKQYTLELCRLMKRAGCMFVSIGIESCSQEVLNNMDKGIDLEDIEVTLSNMKKAYVWAHCFMINNFEGETDKNRWETFFYIRKYKDLFTSIGIGNFTLSRNAKIYKKIELSDENIEISDFSNDLIYTSRTAISKDKAELLRECYNNINFTSYFFCNCFFEREHLAVWLSINNGFLYSDYLMKEYINKIQYNSRFLLKKVVNGKLYLYALKTRKFYILPKEFLDIINSFDGNIEKLLDTPQMLIFNNKEDIINFLLKELYV